MAKKSTVSGKKRLVLLDAHAIIHRAYHALPEFTSSTGEPTGALYGLAAMLLKLIQDLKPDYLAACYDLPGPTYRHEVYEKYKGTRPELESNLKSQLNRSRDIFEAFSIPMYEKPGFEADDILGTIVEMVKDDKELEVVIASGDMDTLQLVQGKKVQVFTLKKGIQDTVLYDEDAVVARFGFPPKLLPDYKGLRGDPSDNIIGVPGIGEKTATDLIVQFGSLEKLFSLLKKNKQALAEKGIKPRIVDLLVTHEEEAIFSKMLASIRRDAAISFVLGETWKMSFSIDKVLALFTELNFKTLATRAREVLGPSSVLLDLPETQSVVTPVAEVIDPVELKKLQIAAWLLDSERTNPTRDDVLHIAKTDTLSQAGPILRDMLAKEELSHIYTDIELPLIPVIHTMEQSGVLIDIDFLKRLSNEYHQELAKLERVIHGHAGVDFNINSPKQLSEVLFDTLALKAKNQKKTETGLRSTKESELEKIRDLHPIVDAVLQYRELQKLLSTYIDSIPTQVDGEKRLHTTFFQTGTSTGRMSSQYPNLQNIPIRTDLGRRIREAFIAPTGSVLLSLDYSQIELRVAAFLSGDEKLIAIFKEGGDVHAAVAAEVFQVPPEHVDREMRRRAKIINFGILYGMGVTALKTNLGTTRDEAQQFYNEYFKNFSGLAAYLDDTKRNARRLGYTKTLYGRKRYLAALRSSLPYVVAQAERMAINAPIQGTQADVIKIAMARADAYLLAEQLSDRARLLLQVHDELVLEVREDVLPTVAAHMKDIMESVLTAVETKGVPILVGVNVGKNWGSMESLTIE
jgi:DNA polymerase I